MSKQALLNVNLIAARKGAAELEFAVKKINNLDYFIIALRFSF